jgi:prefoldin subunit 5
MPFAPFTFTKEQETQMLQQQMKALESHLDAIRERIQELEKEE